MYKNNTIKTKKQQQIMRDAGKLLAEILNDLKSIIKPGVESLQLENRFQNFCKKNNLIPACEGYSPYDLPPFPTGLCISFNDQSVHCYPKKDQKLQEGDIITVDTVVKYKGFHVDAAFTTGIGEISKSKQKLINVTEKTMYDAIALVRPGIKIGLISNTIYRAAKSNGYDVLRDYAGHGIGKSMHEYPNIPCYGDVEEGPTLLEGMTISIEPLITEGGPELIHSQNQWETRTADRKDFAEFEHTVLVTKEGYEILTKLD